MFGVGVVCKSAKCVCCIFAELIVENDEPSDQRHDEDPINVDDLMLDSSVMFPTFDNSTDDVNDLFGELELLLSVSTVYPAFKNGNGNC